MTGDLFLLSERQIARIYALSMLEPARNLHLFFAALAGDGWRPVLIMVAVGVVATVANDGSLITING